MEAWETAKSDGSASLLPAGESEVFGRVYFELQQENMPYSAMNANIDAQYQFAVQTGLNIEPGKITTLSLADRDKEAGLLANDIALRQRDLERWEVFAIANHAVLNSVSSLEQLRSSFSKAKPYHP